MKKGILLSTAIFLALVSLSYAQQEPQKGELHGSIGATFTSKYIWRGFDIFGDKSAIHPEVDVDLFGTGFGINVTAHRANSSGFEEFVPGMHAGERWDYALYYQNMLFADQPYATNYRASWVYYNYPDNENEDFDLQELNAVLAWPKILPIKGLVPAYAIVKLWPSSSGSLIGAPRSNGTASGWAHIVMLDYALPIICPLTNIERTLNLHSEIVYNDGVGPNGANVDHDWSNAVLGVSTNFDITESIVFTPGIFHQITMDKTVNDDKDETWVSLGLKYKF